MKQSSFFVTLSKRAALLLCLPLLIISSFGCSSASRATPTDRVASTPTPTHTTTVTETPTAESALVSHSSSAASAPATNTSRTNVSQTSSTASSQPNASANNNKQLTRIVCDYQDATDEEYLFEYDKKGRIVSILNRNLNGTTKITQTLTYDAKGRLLQMDFTAEKTSQTHYQYDEQGQLIGEHSSESGGFETAHSYNSNGKRVRSVGSGGGVKTTTTYQYDASGLLTEAIHTTKHTTNNTHKVQTLRYDTTCYQPFTIVTTCENDKALWRTLEFRNKDGINLLSQNTITLSERITAFWDADAYLTELEDANGNRYTFYYNSK